MKRIALSLLLAVSAALVHAQSPATPVVAGAPGAADVPVASEPPVASEAAADAAPAADAAAPGAEAAEETVVMAHPAKPETPRHCLRDTGTRIQRRDRDGCTNGIGESYSGEELRRTGARDNAEALRLLSPRFGG